MSEGTSQSMQVNPQRAKQLVENAARVVQQINSANTAGRNVSLDLSHHPFFDTHGHGGKKHST